MLKFFKLFLIGLLIQPVLSITPEELGEAIKSRLPGFSMDYDIDPLRQSIADSWPDSLDDSIARDEWGWDYKFDLYAMVDDMLDNLSNKLSDES